MQCRDAEAWEMIERAKSAYKSAETRAVRKYTKAVDELNRFYGPADLRDDVSKTSYNLGVLKASREEADTIKKAVYRFNMRMANVREFVKNNNLEKIVRVPSDKAMYFF